LKPPRATPLHRIDQFPGDGSKPARFQGSWWAGSIRNLIEAMVGSGEGLSVIMAARDVAGQVGDLGGPTGFGGVQVRAATNPIHASAPATTKAIQLTQTGIIVPRTVTGQPASARMNCRTLMIANNAAANIA
jgi:hypothetical protein